MALGQTYFAVQTRRQELAETATEEDRRLLLRRELALHNVKLAGVARDAGVVAPVDYAIFQNHGYMGLYGCLTAQDIHARKRLKGGQQILDHMGSTELAANLFRATQTEEKLRRGGIPLVSPLILASSGSARTEPSRRNVAKGSRADGWSAAESRFLRSYAGRVIRGRFGSALEAAVACQRRLATHKR